MTATHYEVLGVPERATPEQIQARYAALLQELRAKLGAGTPELPSRLAAIRTAYKVLSDPSSRLAYDKGLPSLRHANQAAQEPGHAYGARSGYRAWKVFWLLLLPTLALALSLGTATAQIALLILVLAVPRLLVIAAVVAILCAPVACAMLLWRSAFNVKTKRWGYANRTVSAVSVLAVSAVVVTLAPLLGVAVSDPVSKQAAARKRQADDRQYTNKTPAESLLIAAKQGDRQMVQKLLAQGVDVNTRETSRPNVGRTPLHYAAGGTQYSASGEHVEVANLLIKKGADPNAKAEGGYTPLHIASGLGQKDMVELLLKAGSDPNALDVRGAPLHAAVLQGHKDVVAQLLKGGASPNGLDARGMRPLDVLGHMAAWQPGHDEIVEMLVRNGAVLTRVDNARSPLEVVVLRDRKKLAMFLIDQKAPIDDGVIGAIGSNGHRELADYLLERKLLSFDHPQPGTTLLHGAACFSGAEFFDWTLSNSKNVNHPDKDGKTALHKAAACLKGDRIDRLIAKGGDVRAKDAKGRTPLGELSSPSIEIVGAFLKAGADPNEVRGDGSTVLMSMVQANDAAPIELLIAHGADVNARNRWGNSALHDAARLNKVRVAEALLKDKQIKLNELNSQGKAPLHLAAESGARDIVRLLLQKGADRSVKTADGKTALQLVEQRGPAWHETAQLLQ